jgi:hypothetical protein
MMTKLIAKVASLTDDGYATVLAFADDPGKPLNSVLLSLTNHPDIQDVDLGHGGVHLEAEAFRLHGYDLVEDIRKTDCGVVVKIRLDAATQAGIGQDLEIEFQDEALSVPFIDRALLRFNQRITAWARGNAPQ